MPGISLFVKALEKSHPNLHFPTMTKLGVCDKCTHLRTRKIYARSATERAAVRRQMREHTQRHQGDRRAFYRRRVASSISPLLQWSILSDSTSGYVVLLHLLILLFHNY